MNLSLPTSTTTKDAGINTPAISVQKSREHVQGVTSKEVDAVFTDHVQRTVLSAESTSNIKRFVKRLP